MPTFYTTGTQTAVALATPELTTVNGQVTTTSQQIAAHFGKTHRGVLRAIRNLECSDGYRLRNFAQSSYRNEQGKEQPCFHITRDGFVFLAMGFTGKEAGHWKESYIEAFNAMEAQLHQPRNPAIDYTRISPADKQAVRKAVAQRAGKDSTAYQTIYNALHTHFGVNSYHELADDALPEVLEVIARHAADWELVEEAPKDGTVNAAVDKMVGWVKAGNGYPVELFMPIYEAITEKMERIKARGMPPAIDPLNARALVSARKAANEYFDNYRDAVKTGKPNPTMGELPPDVLHGIVAQALFDQRMLSYFDWTTGRMHTQLVPGDSSVFSFSRGDYSAMAENIPMERLPEALAALNQRVTTHIGAFHQMLSHRTHAAH